jgi:hypothetical protein
MRTFGPLQLTLYSCFLTEFFTVDSSSDRLGLGQEFRGGGLIPDPGKFPDVHFMLKLEYHTDAGKFEILMLGGL